MRPTTPRVTPLALNECSPEQKALLEPFVQSGTLWNVFKTLVRHPSLFKRWLPFANHVLFKQSLTPREREMLILRIGWLCRAPYEWTQHVQIGLRSGITEAEVERIADGPEAPGWSEHDAALVRAADDLHRDCCLSEATWNTLSKRYTTEQLVDVVFTVGQYNLVSMALNTFGVEIDPELPRFHRTPN
ncbi:MAG: carboxymuconolactone decarboxylase family protein [Gammaproteobacteria bacterium]|nr:carboxymuconolactone decarboxylase family protein [Gammaproteobacteria bacterium]